MRPRLKFELYEYRNGGRIENVGLGQEYYTRYLNQILYFDLK